MIKYPRSYLSLIIITVKEERSSLKGFIEETEERRTAKNEEIRQFRVRKFCSVHTCRYILLYVPLIMTLAHKQDQGSNQGILACRAGTRAPPAGTHETKNQKNLMFYACRPM
jgi:hypothetical protein